MGKRILVQRRGKSPRFKASTHKRISKARYPNVMPEEMNSKLDCEIIDLLHESGRGTPLAKIHREDNVTFYIPAIEGIYIGQKLEQGQHAKLNVGNILFLGQIPEGAWICNIELTHSDGGALVRTSGGHAIVMTHSGDQTSIRLPSGQIKWLRQNVRASIGVIAAGGRTEKPFLKAGKKRALKKAKGHGYPVVRGVAMNTVSHPHGGGAHQSPHRPTTVSRHAPPGRKVGMIAARRTGRKRGRIRR
ncbi:MAG: 50S ribosomal protein L2 [Candidatus Hodarchaeota archaeon]